MIKKFKIHHVSHAFTATENISTYAPELLMGWAGPIKVGPWFVKLQPSPLMVFPKKMAQPMGAHGPHILLKFIANKIWLIISIIDICYCLLVFYLIN